MIAVVAATLAAALTGCASNAACVAPSATVPATVAAGEANTLEVSNLYASCNDTGQGAAAPAREVTITLRNAATEPVASPTAPVNTDATATVVLEVPATASGRYVLDTNGTALGEVTVTPPN
jgi:hypothetical protein